MSAAPRGFDGGDVDFLHCHHRVDRTLEVAVEDLEGVIAFAIERNLISWEQVAIACVV